MVPVHNMLMLMTVTHQPGDSLLPLYYMSAIIVSVGTAVWGLLRWHEQQRQKWQAEAANDAHIGDELKNNTEAAKRNTEAIDRLSVKLDQFASRVDAQLSDHNSRISRMEGSRHRERQWPANQG